MSISIMGNDMFKMTKIYLMIFYILFIGSCAAPTVRQTIVLPGLEPGIAEAKKIAIIPFVGDRRGWFTGELEAFFVNLTVKGQKYFQVLELTSYKSFISKMRHLGDRVGYKDYKQLGRMSGAEVFITGKVSLPRGRRKDFEKETDECIEKNEKNECVKFVITNCVLSTSSIRFDLKVVKSATGQIIVSKPFQAQFKAEACGEHPAIPSQRDMTYHVLKTVLKNLRRDVAPYEVQIVISFMNEDDPIKKHKQAQAGFKRAIDHANHHRLQLACDQFGQVDKLQKSAAVLYNLGVCAEAFEDIPMAQSYYLKAQRIASGDQRQISRALNRIKQKQINANKVDSQMQ